MKLYHEYNRGKQITKRDSITLLDIATCGIEFRWDEYESISELSSGGSFLSMDGIEVRRVV